MHRKAIFLGVLISIIYTSYAQVFYLPSSVIIWDGFERNPVKRKTSYPYVSGDTFRAFCDHVFDETKTYIDADAVKPGDTVFLVGDVLPFFFQEVYKHIQHPFVIVTHNRDDALPGDFSSYLDDEKILAWFTVNLDRSHPKLHAIPIGLANSCWPHGDTNIVKMRAQEAARKTILLCASFVLPTHASRQTIYNLFRGKSYCYFAMKKPYDEYLKDLRASKFVLSPRGNGLDCHRTWEVLLMGAVPIVPSTTINDLYRDLPVIVVEDWKCLTQGFLEQKWSEFERVTFTMEKLYADYWFNLISQQAQHARHANA